MKHSEIQFLVPCNATALLTFLWSCTYDTATCDSAANIGRSERVGAGYNVITVTGSR